MKMQFCKYHGTGNDFVLVDCTKQFFVPEKKQLVKICDRHFGVGADGFIVIMEKDGFDFEMLYFNSDGRPGSLCGNGGRCAAAFAYELGLCGKQLRFLAYDGPHKAEIHSSSIKLQMSDIDHLEKMGADYYLNTGSPHYVTFVKRLDRVNVYDRGRMIRNKPIFKKLGTNVNFVQLHSNHIEVRTYERGVEEETLSCGTGVCASAVCASLISPSSFAGPCRVITKGGMLNVYFTKKEEDAFTGIWLEGPAERVFQGVIDI